MGDVLPREMGRGAGMTCWRRLRAWQKAGVWGGCTRYGPPSMRHAEQIDFSRVVADLASIRAVHGEKTGPNTQPIAVRRAVNTTSLPTRGAFR